MQELHAGIDRVIRIARTLRDVAGELGKVDLKSQIIDEISTLQELRDEVDSLLESAVTKGSSAASSDQDTETLSTSDFKLGESTMAVIQPTGDTDTYQIAPEPEPAPPASPGDGSASADGDSTEGTSGDAAAGGATSGSGAGGAASGDAPGGDAATMSEDERARRAAQAEARIAELEPLHAAASRRVNDVLTPEQNQIRVKATKAARAAGKTGADARRYVYAAMKLSTEQKAQLAEARKELSSIRAAIAREIEFLLDDDQKKRVASEAHIPISGS